MQINSPEFQGIQNKDILQCLKTLLSITAGSVCLDRELGVDTNVLSMTVAAAKNTYSAEVIQKIDVYEPRVTVEEVTWEESDANQGMLKPVIVLSMNEGYDGDAGTVEDEGLYHFWDDESGE